MSRTLYVADALPGAGKTQAFIDKLDPNKATKYLYAVPTKVLNNELVERIGGRYRVLPINSDSYEGVAQRADEALSEPDPKIVIVTHETLSKIDAAMLHDWVVVIDEAPTVSDCRTMNIGATAYEDILSKYLDAGDEADEVTINLGMVRDATYIYCEERTNRGMQTIAECLGALLDGRSKVYISEFFNQKKSRPEHRIRIVRYKDYLPVYLHASEVHILGAKVRNSLAIKHAEANGYALARSRYAPDAKPYPSRNTIFPLVGGEHISKTMLLTKGDGTLATRWEQGVFGEKLLDSVVDVVEDRPAVVTKMSWCGYDFPDHYQVIPFDSRGLNDYRDYDVSVCLFHGNPEPWEARNQVDMARMMRMDARVVDEALRYERYHSTILQASTRTSIRLSEESRECLFFVPTEGAAEELALTLSGSTNIDRSLMSTPPSRLPSEGRKQRNMERDHLASQARTLKDRGLTQRDIANRLGISQPSVNRFLRA